MTSTTRSVTDSTLHIDEAKRVLQQAADALRVHALQTPGNVSLCSLAESMESAIWMINYVTLWTRLAEAYLGGEADEATERVD